MGEMWFAFKATIITIVMVFFMQIKIGQNTVEQNAYQWIKSSYLVSHLNDVSRGAVVAIREAYQGLSSSMTAKVKKTFKDEFQPGERSLVPDIRRSREYLGDLSEQMKNVDIKKVKQQMKDYRSQLKSIDEDLSRKPSSEQ